MKMPPSQHVVVAQSVNVSNQVLHVPLKIATLHTSRQAFAAIGG